MRALSSHRVTATGRRLVAVTTLVFGLGLMSVVSAAPASAHAFLWDSNPADGAVLTDAPANLRLEFSESVLLSATRIELVDGDGKHYSPTDLRAVEGGHGSGGTHPVEVVATLPILPRSTYRVSWQTISADDLHVTSGVIVFGISTPVHAAGLDEPVPRLDEAALRWLLFALLSGAFGGALTAALARRRPAVVASATVRQAERLAALCAAAGAAAAIGLFVDQVAVGGLGLHSIVFSGYGVRWMLRLSGFAFLLAGSIRAIRRPMAAGVLRRALTFVGATAVCLGSGLLGHAAAGSPMSVTRIGADALHLAAAATWAGLLIAAILVIVPLLRAGGAAAAAGRLVLRGYAMPATACVTVIVVTGVYLASSVVGSVDAAILTFYGRTLLLKVAVFAVAASLGLVNTLRLRSPRESDGVGRTVIVEGVVAVLVLAMAAILTSSQPAREPRFVTVTTASTVPVVDGAAADLQESLSIRPNRPGKNVILIDVFDTRRPSPAPVRGVTVTIVGLDGSRTAALPAQALSDGQWSLNTVLSAPGRTRVEVDVERPGMLAVSRNFSWTVAGAPAVTRPATVSTAPLGSSLRFAAIVLAMCCLSGWVIVLAGRRTPSAGRRRQRHREPQSGSRLETDKTPSKV